MVFQVKKCQFKVKIKDTRTMPMNTETLLGIVDDFEMVFVY